MAAGTAAGCSTCGSATASKWYPSAQGAKVCKACYGKAYYAKRRAARSADEAALHRETERKRHRLAHELGSSASLEDVVLQLNAEFVCLGDLRRLDAEFASLDPDF